jgi:nucleoid DNA-binding protein
MTISTSGIIAKMHKAYKGEITKAAVKEIVQDFIENVREGLASKDIVRVDKLGVFRVKPYAARKGRNPRTGETVKIQARDKVVFKATKSVRERVAKKARASR